MIFPEAYVKNLMDGQVTDISGFTSLEGYTPVECEIFKNDIRYTLARQSADTWAVTQH